MEEKDFLKNEIEALRTEALSKELGKKGIDDEEDLLVEAGYESAEKRTKGYTSRQCCLVFEQTSIDPYEIDFVLAVEGQHDYLSLLRRMAYQILSMELEIELGKVLTISISP